MAYVADRPAATETRVRDQSPEIVRPLSAHVYMFSLYVVLTVARLCAPSFLSPSLLRTIVSHPSRSSLPRMIGSCRPHCPLNSIRHMSTSRTRPASSRRAPSTRSPTLTRPCVRAFVHRACLGPRAVFVRTRAFAVYRRTATGQTTTKRCRSTSARTSSRCIGARTSRTDRCTWYVRPSLQTPFSLCRLHPSLVRSPPSSSCIHSLPSCGASRVLCDALFSLHALLHMAVSGEMVHGRY